MSESFIEFFFFEKRDYLFYVSHFCGFVKFIMVITITAFKYKCNIKYE